VGFERKKWIRIPSKESETLIPVIPAIKIMHDGDENDESDGRGGEVVERRSHPLAQASGGQGILGPISS
jgi:hypothetical protein